MKFNYEKAVCPPRISDTRECAHVKYAPECQSDRDCKGGYKCVIYFTFSFHLDSLTLIRRTLDKNLLVLNFKPKNVLQREKNQYVRYTRVKNEYLINFIGIRNFKNLCRIRV